MKRQQPVVSERVYREVISRAEQGKVPLYPSVVRKKAIERYKTEKIAELKRAQEEAERKIREEQIRREERRRRAEQQRQEQYRKAEEASKGRVHTGQWVKIEEGGKSVSVRDMAALSPSQAKALGFKWGTFKANPQTGTFEFVPLPTPTEPTEPEYYGLLKWKYESGYYKNVPQMEKIIKKEIEVGGKKYGIKAPAWASGFAKEYEAVARQIKQAYTKASEYAAKPAPSELKKTKKKSVPKSITKQNISQYQRLTTLAQHPEVQAYINKMQSLQSISTELQTQGVEIERQTEAHNKLVTELNRTFEEYQKGGWTPEEIAKYNLLAGAVTGIEKELEPKITKYEKRAKKLEKTLKQPKSKVVKEFETLSKSFMEQYSPKQISQIEKAMIVSFPAKKQPMQEVTFTGLGEYIKSTGRVPVFTIPEQAYPRPPTAIESLIEPIKRLTGHYPEKEKALSSTLSTYRKQQLGLAESLGIIHKERGKRYIIVNNTKYYEGTKGFDEHLGEAIQSKLSIKPPPEVKRRQEAIHEAERIKSEFMKTYGAKPGEPIILATPESQKAFERVRSAFEAIPEESATTKAYWEEARKIRQAQPQIEEINVLAKQVTKQAKEMERIQKERLFGIPYKIETLEEKYSPTKKFIPPVTPYAEVKTPEDLVKAIKETYKWGGTKLTKQQEEAIRESFKKGERISKSYRRVWGLPSEPFEWEKKAAQLTAGIKTGQVEEIREHPVKGAITVASFAALPPMFKGAKYLWGIRAGETVGMAAKLPVLTKYAPKFVMGGMGAGYAGAVGYEAYKAPTLQSKGKVFGRASVELAEMSAGAYIGAKAMPSYLKKIEVSQFGAKKIYRGLGIGEVPRPVFGYYKEELKTPDINLVRRDLVLGKKFHVLEQSKKFAERIAGGRVSKKPARQWTHEDIKSVEEYLAMHRARGGEARAQKFEELEKKKMALKKEPYETVFTSGIAPSEIYGGVVPSPRIKMPKLPRPSHLPPEMMTSGIIKGEELKIFGHKYPEHEVRMINGLIGKPPGARLGLTEGQWVSGLTESEAARIKSMSKPPKDILTQELISRIIKPHAYSSEQTERLLKSLEEPKTGGYYHFYKKSVLTIPEDLPLQIRSKRIGSKMVGEPPKDMLMQELIKRIVKPQAYPEHTTKHILKMMEEPKTGESYYELYKKSILTVPEDLPLQIRFKRLKQSKQEVLGSATDFLRSLKFPQIYGEAPVIIKSEQVPPIQIGKISSMKDMRIRYAGDARVIIGESESLARQVKRQQSLFLQRVSKQQSPEAAKLMSITGKISKDKVLENLKRNYEIKKSWKKEEEKLLKGGEYARKMVGDQVLIQKTTTKEAKSEAKIQKPQEPKQEQKLAKSIEKSFETEREKVVSGQKDIMKSLVGRAVFIKQPKQKKMQKQYPILFHGKEDYERRIAKNFEELIKKSQPKSLGIQKELQKTPPRYEPFESYKFFYVPVELPKERQSFITSFASVKPGVTPIPATVSVSKPKSPEMPREKLYTEKPYIPEIEFQYFPVPPPIFPSRVKRPRRPGRSPYEWFERHPMPTLRTLFGSGITQKTGMAIMTQLIGVTPKKRSSAKKKPSVSKRKHKAKPSSIPVSGVGMMTQLIGEMPKR